MSRVLPILFNTDMVRAILDGRKTVTRRVIKPQMDVCPSCMHMNVDYIYDQNAQNIYCARCGEPLQEKKPPYHPGDILYVRETWNFVYEMDDSDQIIEDTGHYVYCADDPMPFSHWVDADTGEHKDYMPWRPSIHMPKRAVRIWLKVTDIRVERLQDITNEQILKEGIGRDTVVHYLSQFPENTEEWERAAHLIPFVELWNSTVKKKDIGVYDWYANPYVFVIEFEQCEKPEGI